MNFRLDIPFIPSRGFECGQTCVAMVIKYFQPSFEPNFDEFNNLIHHKPGKYTFPLQDAILLNHYGVKAKCFSSDNYPTTIEEPGLFKRWYKEDYDQLKEFVDEESFNWMVLETRKYDLFEKKVTTMNDILDIAAEGNLAAVVIDWSTLSTKPGLYQGHMVLVSGLEGDTVLIHDPDIGPYQPYPVALFEKAYSHPNITHDLFVGYAR